MGRLDGKVALVTGAARGTGEQVARLFADEGARVLVADVLEEPGRAVASSLGDAGHFVCLDVTSEQSWRSAVEEGTSHFGGLTVLVNNAGVLKMAAIEDTSQEDFERIVRVNQLGPFLGIKAVIPSLREAGGGAIVNVSSVDGMSAKNGIVAYAASKWAVRGITRVAALELGKWGIRVNTVCPEAGGPGMRAPYVPDGIDPAYTLAFTHKLLPYQQQRPSEEIIRDIARMILFLASDESLSCTGGDYPVDAGWLAGHHDRFAPGA